MSYSTERQQIKRKTTHRDHRWNHSKRGLRLLEAGSPQRHLVTQDWRACTVSGPATTLNDRPKSASHEVFGWTTGSPFNQDRLNLGRLLSRNINSLAVLL